MVSYIEVRDLYVMATPIYIRSYIHMPVVIKAVH